MKKIFYTIVTLLFTISLLSACGGGKSKSTPLTDPNPDTEVPDKNPNTPPQTNKKIQNISINILDISGVKLNREVTLTFVGTPLLDTQEKKVTHLNLAAGKSLVKLHTTSLVDAKDLKILTKASGYFDTGATIQLKKGELKYQQNIFLIPEKAGKVKEGIYTQIDILKDIDSNGKSNKEVTLTLQENSSTPMVKVTIPKGTTLSDAKGKAVSPKAGFIVRFDPSEANVLDAYPGGLSVRADVAGTMEQVDFKSAGFASIVLKDKAGNKVKKFDKDITIAMQFKKGTTNADGIVVNVGDSVPIWSYDEDKGTWVFEEDGIVKDLDASDNLYDVVYKTNHLTYYNLDWKDDYCDAHINLTDSSGTIQNNVLRVVMKLDDYNVKKSFIYRGDGFIDLKRIPDSRNWTLEFYDPFTGEKLDYHSSNLSLCGSHNLSIDPPAVGNLPVTKTEVMVRLACPTGKAVPGVKGVKDKIDTIKTIYPVDVVVFDDKNFLFEYGMAINEPFDFRTYDDGVLNIYDLPRSYYDRTLNVNILPMGEKHTDLVRLALRNTQGPFPVKIGRDRSINDIELMLPDDFCNAGGFATSKITATVSCPTGNIPNTQSQSAPFAGSIKAVKSVGEQGSGLFTFFNNKGVSNLRLLKGTDYKLTFSHQDSAINESITNPISDINVLSGVDRSFNFTLSEAYCNGEVETQTYNYQIKGGAVTETPHINASGTIDLKDFFFPPSSTQLRYFEYDKFMSQSEERTPTATNVSVNGNNVSYTESYGDKTDFAISANSIKLTNYDSEDGTLTKTRDTVIGRFYNTGDTFYELDFTNSDTDMSFTFHQKCTIDARMSTFSPRTEHNYNGDIIKVKCTYSGVMNSSGNGGSQSTPFNKTDYLYFQKGIGLIVEIDESCSGGPLGNNTEGCTPVSYTNKYYVESAAIQ